MRAGLLARLDRGAVRRLIVGSALGAAALWLTFRHTDVRAVGHAIERVHLWPLWAALLLVGATVTVAARRWELLVYWGARSRHLPQFLAAITVGQMLNVLLPVRLGEVVRAYWISRSQRQPLGRVLATIAVERLTDICILGVSVTVVLTQVPLPAWAINSGRIALAVSAGAAVLAIVLGKWGGSAARLVEAPLRILPTRVALFLRRQGRTGLEELRALGDWRVSARVWALSLIVVALAAATNYVLFRAFDFPLSPMTALLLFVVLQIGGAPASTPGNIGVFHYLATLVLTMSGIDRSEAVAYAVVLHAIAIGPKIVAGAVILAAARTPLLEPAMWSQSALKTAHQAAAE